MDSHVLFTLALGVPQDRDFNRLNVGRIDGVDLVFAEQLIASRKRGLSARNAQTQKWLDHAVAPAPAAGTIGGRWAVRATLLPTSICIVDSPGKTTTVKPRSNVGQPSASPRTMIFQEIE